jgi:hypothetical protein
MKTPTEQARWRRSQIAETFASVRESAPWKRLVNLPALTKCPYRSMESIRKCR